MYLLSDIEMVRAGRVILKVDQLALPTDKLTVVLGHNGSGKSTLVSLLSGQQSPDSGNIKLHDKPVSNYSSRQLAKEVAFLPQKLPASAGLTVKELVKLGRFPWRGVLGRWQSADEAIVLQAMDKTGVQAYSEHLADQLSGGERQRAWIAMLLAQQSPVLILDEPTSALDVHHQYQVMQLLHDLNQQAGVGVIVILHDINLALRYASHVVALKHGEVAFSGDVELLNDEKRLSALYQTDITLIDHPSDQTQSHKVAVVCA